MQLNKHYVLGLALSFALVACGKDEKTKTVTVDNPKTVEELKKATAERDALAEKVKLADTGTAKLKTDLEAANKKVEDLTTSLAAKETELTKAKKDLVEAQKSESDKVKELKDKVADLEGQVKTLTADLKTAQQDKTNLTAVVDAAKRDEAQYQAILDYAVKNGAKNRADIGTHLDGDLAVVDKKIADLATAEPVLSNAIAEQSKVVLDAKAQLEFDEKNLLKKLDELEAGVKAGTVKEDDQLYVALKNYKEASASLVTEDANKASIEGAIKGLNKDIEGLNTTLAQAEKELKGYNDELLALAIAGKLDTPRAKELPAKIDASKATIAKTTVAKDEKVKALGEQDKKLEASKAEIKKLKTVQGESLQVYNDTTLQADKDAIEVAEKELELRLNALKAAQKDAADQKTEKTRLTGLKEFFETKLKAAK